MLAASSDYESWTKEKLISRICDLEAAIEALSRSTGFDKAGILKVAFGLTPIEARYAAVLSSGTVKCKDAIFDAIYCDRRDAPNVEILRAVAHRVRDKLFPFGVTIETVHGVGYLMNNAEVVKAAMDGGDVSRFQEVGVEALEKREKWRLILAFIRSRRDRKGMSQFTTAEAKEASGLIGGLAPIIASLERRGVLRIIARPTKIGARRNWRVAMKEAVDV